MLPGSSQHLPAATPGLLGAGSAGGSGLLPHMGTGERQQSGQAHTGLRLSGERWIAWEPGAGLCTAARKAVAWPHLRPIHNPSVPSPTCLLPPPPAAAVARRLSEQAERRRSVHTPSTGGSALGSAGGGSAGAAPGSAGGASSGPGTPGEHAHPYGRVIDFIPEGGDLAGVLGDGEDVAVVRVLSAPQAIPPTEATGAR